MKESTRTLNNMKESTKRVKFVSTRKLNFMMISTGN